MNQNINLEKDEHVLTIVDSQQTYYLKKPHVNADNLSALIDWTNNEKERSLINVIDKYRIKYLFYDKAFVDRRLNVKKLINELTTSGKITLLRETKSDLYTSRIKNTKILVKTMLYQVN